MTWTTRIAGTALLAVAAGVSAQSLTFYESPGFGGRSFSANGTIANFERFGFNDRASSVVIRSGRWQFCTDANFSGNCVTLAPGSYPDLGAIGLSNRVSSARVARGGPPSGDGYRPPPPPPGGGYRPPPPPPPQSGGPGRGTAVTLFDGENLTGDRYSVSGSMSNLDATQWNDRARSMIVRYGNWQLCSDANFRNNCKVYPPGRYDTLGSLAGGLSSLRPVR